MYSVIFLFVIFVLHIQTAGGLNNAGRTFVQTFNFNDPSVEPGVIHAFIISTQADSCPITITIYSNPIKTSDIVVTNAEAVVQSLTIKSAVGVKLNASTCDFVVYGLNFAKESADGWLAYPVESLGTEYVVLGVEPWLASPIQLSIIAANDDTVCTSKFPNGTVRTSRLNAVGVDFITSNRDMTGTLINCTDKVSVITGQECSNFPKGCRACDHTVEQVPPKTTLGRNFAMIPLSHSCSKAPTCCTDKKFCAGCLEIFRILAVDDDTVVHRNGTKTSETFTLNAGQSRYILISQQEFAYLTASKPVLLGQYFQGQDFEGTNQDPAFAIIPQIESYAQIYQAATCFPQFDVHFVNLVIRKNTSQSVLLNGLPFLDPNSAVPLPGIDYDAFQYKFDCSNASGANGVSFTMRHEQNLTFGLFAYGFSSWISYGYPGGMNLNEDPYFTCPEPAMNTTAPNVTRLESCDPSIDDAQFAQPDVYTDAADACCNGTSTLTHNDTIIKSTFCQVTVLRTWTLTDPCGRVINLNQTAVIERSLDVYTPPPQDDDFHGPCSAFNKSRELELERNCSTTISVSYKQNSDNITNVVNRTWTIKQQCTNETIQYNQTVHCEPEPQTTTELTTNATTTQDQATTVATTVAETTTNPTTTTTTASTSSPTTQADPTQTSTTTPGNSTEKPCPCQHRCPCKKPRKPKCPCKKHKHHHHHRKCESEEDDNDSSYSDEED